ncbi:hypothetical protein BDZ89DRAFT_1099705 [Hymenopellis radicata]|nr:hypothetical protein BDZ89DRAFT_1099705 [Hymenopellis radicata]
MPATLYTFSASIWGAAAELAVAQLGYPAGAVEVKTINLVEGQNFEPSFLDKNINGTLPTLDVDGEVYKNTTDVLIRVIHEEQYDPNFALLLVRNPEELAAKAAAIPKLFVAGRQATLNRLVADPAAAKYADFYKAKLEGNGFLLNFFEVSQAHFEKLRALIYEILPKQLQAENGEADFHVVAWLTRIAATSGGTSAGDAVEAIEKSFGAPLPPTVKSFFTKWIPRDSWKTVYGTAGLH